MKLCKDCKHYEVKDFDKCMELHWCLRSMEIYDLVDGSRTGIAYSCHSEREEKQSSDATDRCGREGKFWEAK